MKKRGILSVLSVLVLIVFVVLAIGSTEDEEPEAVEEAPEEEPAEEVDEAVEEDEEIDGNSRTNPAGLNESFIVSKDSIFVGKATIELEMVELVSGDEAWTMVREANMFNEEPAEGKEYILAKFRVKVIETEEDDPYEVNHAQFDAVSEAGVTYDEFISVSGLEPSLRADLYEGAEHHGYTYFIVDKDDSPVAAHDRGRNSEVWFDLRCGQ